jgi:CRP-like cAMP-binding protein
MYEQNDPRMASVTALTDTVCLGLSRAVFRSALSSARFAELLYTVINQRKKARKKRQIEHHSRYIYIFMYEVEHSLRYIYIHIYVYIYQVEIGRSNTSLILTPVTLISFAGIK